LFKWSGDSSEKVTRDPIPNSNVKVLSTDGITS